MADVQPSTHPVQNPAAQRLISFFKMTGSGNDFIIIDNRNGEIDADHCRELVKSACRRKLSVGADGLILIENDPEADFKWRFFNADGSEAEMCGNGARCAARFAYLQNIVQKPRMAFRTLAGIIEAEMCGERVKIRITPPQGIRPDLRMEVEENSFYVHFINTGVPHVVWFFDDEAALEKADVLRYGRTLRFHPDFQPAGTNVNFACIDGEHSMIIRTYERGVEGETLACGTGAVASALIAAVRKRVSSPVGVRTRGGEVLTIYFEQQDLPEFSGVYLEGDAKVVYRAELWDETLR